MQLAEMKPIPERALLTNSCYAGDQVTGIIRGTYILLKDPDEGGEVPWLRAYYREKWR